MNEPPPRIKKLPRDQHGNAIPFFLGATNGKPETKVGDRTKWRDCLKFNFCWLCGEKLGKFQTFIIDPMKAINRMATEPGCHHDCAEWWARTCHKPAGIACLWTTQHSRIAMDGKIVVSEADAVSWWKDGRAATKPEILLVMDTGMPELIKNCRSRMEREDAEFRRRQLTEFLPT